jgi:hypothetical protein
VIEVRRFSGKEEMRSMTLKFGLFLSGLEYRDDGSGLSL